MNEIVKETEASLELDTLGKRLRWEMKKKHLTAKAVAEELGFSRIRIGKILNDEIQPNYLTMIGLKTILGLTSTEAVKLFFGVTERARDKGGRDKGL